MSSSRRRMVGFVLVLVLVGELLALGVHGTFAAESSQATNPATSLGTGTLTLATRSPSSTGTFCLSSTLRPATPATDDIKTCGALTISGGPFYPGQSSTVTIRVVNTSSLNAGDLAVWAHTACSGTLCGQLEFYLQETASTGQALQCFWPLTSGTTCAFTSTFTSAHTLTAFTNKYKNTGRRLTLTGGLNSLSSRYFTLGLKFPTYSSPTTGNTYQGATATFTLTWYLNQTGP